MEIKIANLVVKKGEKVSEYLDVAEMPFDTLRLPVTVVKGLDDGPILVVTAGIHGSEYPGIRGAQIIAQKYNPEDITGTLIVVHYANPQGFNYQSAFVNPLDGINLNRIWPGHIKSDTFYGAGTISHHLANFIYENIQKKATHYIDLHGGDIPEDVANYAAASKTGDNKLDEKTFDFLKHSLAEYISMGTKSSGHTTDTAADLGIPHMLYEAGKAGLPEIEQIKKQVNAVKNIMKFIKLTKGTPLKPINQKVLGKSSGIRASRGGFFEPYVVGGDLVEEGQIIGKIFDPFGVVREEIKAHKSGVVLVTNFRSAKSIGDQLFGISEIIS